MRKYIVTSICTLALSLLGVFGSNQSASNLNSQLDANLATTNVEQNVTDTQEQNLPTDIEGTVTDKTLKNTDTEKNTNTDKITATPSQISKKDANTTVKTKDNKDVAKTDSNSNSNSAAKAKPTSPAKVESVTAESTNQSTEPVRTDLVSTPERNVQVKTVAYTAPQIKNANINKVVTNTQNLNSNSAKNGQVIVYKNVNLSNCKSTQDVISTLQKNGYNINSNSIQNIAGLKDILALIQNGQTSNSGSNTPAPTIAPTATPTKAPTATPTKAPTATPTKAPTATPTKAPTPTPTKAPTNNSGISSYANQVLQLVNVERAKAGLSAYATNSAITAAANARAKETVQSFSHTRPNGTSFSTVLKEYNVSYRACGENIAYGQDTPQEVVTGWMNSPGHRANILNSNFNIIGIGVYQSSNGTIYWSQEFTN